MPLPYEETSGVSPNPIYESGSFDIVRTWGFSWGFFWGNSWGLTAQQPPYEVTTNTSDPIFDTNSGAGPFLFYETSGPNPDNLFEEN